EVIIRQGAMVIENAQLYTSLRRAFTESETAQRRLLALQRAILVAESSLDVAQVLDAIAFGITDGLEYDLAVAYLIDPATGALYCHVRGVRSDVAPTSHVPDEHNPAARALLAGAVHATRRFSESLFPMLVECGLCEVPASAADGTYVNVPLAVKGEVV